MSKPLLRVKNIDDGACKWALLLVPGHIIECQRHVRIWSEIADTDRKLDELAELVRREHAGCYSRLVQLVVQVKLGDDHDLEGNGTVSDAMSFLHFESLDLFLTFLAVDIVELADLVECVLLNTLVTIRILLLADKPELIR